tara:strand:+ start:3710 stop:3889 length:180 start_codon:yes stop_codon:yes gene_type:complete
MTEEEKDRMHAILERIAMVIGAFIFFLFFANFAIIFFEDLFFNGPEIEVIEELPIPSFR